MKISIKNFKSIDSLVDYEIRPMTILAGVNSSGKSSFIQLLLLLKQTIDLDSSKFQLYLDGDLYQVKEFNDIITGKNIDNKLNVCFEFNRIEFKQVDDATGINIFDSFGDYKCRIEIEYEYNNKKISINLFTVYFILPEGSKKEQFIKFLNIDGAPHIDTNTGIFGNELFFDSPKITQINYSSIYPASYEWLSFDKSMNQGIPTKSIPRIDNIKLLMNTFFKNVSYIGPIREQPKDEYSVKGVENYVGSKGEFVAEVLQCHSDDVISFYQIEQKEDNIDFILVNGTLLQAVKYWMCDIFKVSKDIFAEKTNDFYTIVLANDSGIHTTIKHVGFGISQILPIIVEGLRLPANGTLILEQPEIHLHPKLQSWLFDFLHSLILQGKSVIIETHSDHFITRMRRRIAEDISSTLNNKIRLSFIESKNSHILFRNIDLDDYGTSDFFPEDFIERSHIELKAIVKAQMKKRLKIN